MNGDGDNWSTWEDLLLASAVNRHGAEDWTLVAAAVQARTQRSVPVDPQSCERRFLSLRRRFDGDGDGAISPLVEQLRRLRMAELRRELENHDLSISSLQQRVKALIEEEEKRPSELSVRSLEEEEQERPCDLSLTAIQEEKQELPKTNGIKEEETDLSITSIQEEKQEQPKTNGIKEEENGLSITCLQHEVKEEEIDVAESEPRDHAMGCQHEVKEDMDVAEFEPRDHALDGPDPSKLPITSLKHEVEELQDDCERSLEQDRSRTDESPEKEIDVAESQPPDQAIEPPNVKIDSELGPESGESVAETRGESAQSTAPLSRRRPLRRKPVGEPPIESPPLISFLEILRSHRHSSAFEHRTRSQETARYRNTIRRHVDLAGVRRKVMAGEYVAEAEFFRDLLLMFTNATVFFPKTSMEYSAAVELRQIVRRQINGGESPPLILDLTTVPLIACRKRSEQRGDSERTKRRRTGSDGRWEKMDSSEKGSNGGGVLLEALKNSSKKDEIKRSVGRPPKGSPSTSRARKRNR